MSARNYIKVEAELYPHLKNSLPHLAHKFSHFIFLDSNQHSDTYSTYEWIAAFGNHKCFKPNSSNPLDGLFQFHQKHNDWLFGHLNYDLKNTIEPTLSSKNKDTLAFQQISFFVPETIIYQKEGFIHIESHTSFGIADLETIKNQKQEITASKAVSLSPKTTKETYINQVNSLKKELQFGNIYEVNYCIAFSSEAEINPAKVFENLNHSSKTPFAAFYKNETQYMMCASPERYLKKEGEKIISQPIKGTARRGLNEVQDKQLKNDLYNNTKERSENVMVVDLVRNDLSQTATKASVKVEELFGIYSFPAVHQMISTISSTLKKDVPFTKVLQTTFPMGSMTGAPKISAMKLIDNHENFARSLYAGSVGYITPQGDFDFNVVIRSLFYNSNTKHLSARVGSAITIHCEAEKEYDECLLKAEKLFDALL